MPGIPPETWLVDNEQCDCPPEFLEELVVQSRAKLFVTYAESGDELFLPEEKRSAYLAAISHLWRPWDEIARHISTETGVSVEAAEPYMEISVGPGRSPDINRRGLDRAVSE